MVEGYGLSIATALDELCTPDRTAVIIYDMQVGIVRQIAEGPAVLANCQQLLEAARRGGFRIFFTRHVSLSNRVAGVGQLRRAMLWQRKDRPDETKPMFLQGSEAWSIVKELEPNEDEVILDKVTMSAFEGTFLDLAMRDAGLESFVIAGIALEVGIVPTVKQGEDLNYAPIVVSDACGSQTAEKKEAALAGLRESGETMFADTVELVKLLEAPRRG